MSNISYKRAVDLLRLPDTRMIEQRDNKVARGKSYFIYPHGRIADDDAMRIMAHPNAYAFDDGLFAGMPQSWRIG